MVYIYIYIWDTDDDNQQEMLRKSNKRAKFLCASKANEKKKREKRIKKKNYVHTYIVQIC